MINLQETTLESNNWEGSVGIRNLVYYLARRYARNKKQDEKDAIALCFIRISGCCIGELADGDDDEAEEQTINFVKECLGGQWQ
jgi:hypothetical protein